MLGDVLTSPSLRDSDVESERQVILEELAMDDDSPDDVVHREFARQVFGGHPLGRDTAGERPTVRSLTADEIRRFLADHYRAGNTVVAIAGAVGTDEIRRAVDCAFGAFQSGDGTIARSAPDAVGPDTSIPDDTEQVHLIVGGRALRRLDPDRETLDVVNHVLGRRLVEPVVRRDPRASRPRLQRVLGEPRRTPTPAPGRSTPGRCPTTPATCGR